MRVKDLNPSDRNPRTITDARLAALGESLAAFGDLSGVVYNRRTKSLVGGHQRRKHLDPDWKVVKTAVKDKTGTVAAGYIETPNGRLAYREVDWPIEKERAANIAANAQGGEFDLERLREEQLAISEDGQYINLLGLEDDVLRRLDEGEIVTPARAAAAIPARPKRPRTKRGDVWELGRHRVVCGDSLGDGVAQQVLKGKAAMCFTDPPWNVAIGKSSNPKHRQRVGLANDDLSDKDFKAFLDGIGALLVKVVKGDLYCVLGASEWPNLDLALRGAGYHWSATIIWAKDIFVLGRSNYHRRYEPLWYGWPAKGKSSYNGKRDQDDVWNFARPKKSEEHPTMKPVDLVVKAIVNSSKRGEVVFDPFLGSGTTLLAAESSGRVCAGIELDPGYCDVIVKRWEQFTGKKAKLRDA